MSAEGFTILTKELTILFFFSFFNEKKKTKKMHRAEETSVQKSFDFTSTLSIISRFPQACFSKCQVEASRLCYRCYLLIDILG